jgi:tetratricopeptide (TPR) repeat protein
VPQPAAKNADTSLAEAQRAIDNGDIGRARSIYNALLGGSALPHAAALRLAEGLYRVRDFAGAMRAFQRAGTIVRGEERYHYYYAVALYESGRYADAKRELSAALPYIEVTADITRYRAKIEGAIE